MSRKRTRRPSSSSSSSSTMNPDAPGRQGSKKAKKEGGNELPVIVEEESSSIDMATWDTTVSDDVKAILREEALSALREARPRYTRELLATVASRQITEKDALSLVDKLKDDPLIKRSLQQVDELQKTVEEQTALVEKQAVLVEEQMTRADQQAARMEEQTARVEAMAVELRERMALRPAPQPVPVPPQDTELARRTPQVENKVRMRKDLEDAVHNVMEEPTFSAIDQAVLTEEPAIVANERYARVRTGMLRLIEEKMQVLRAKQYALKVKLIALDVRRQALIVKQQDVKVRETKLAKLLDETLL
ncbi:hypothetical protein DFQ26_009746 [Actinomortierella ambigua]|nr:hypothetical protein DFQ26_009746 [Actinomortierella ambigua]